jgi:hypothetical protein
VGVGAISAKKFAGWEVVLVLQFFWLAGRCCYNFFARQINVTDVVTIELFQSLSELNIWNTAQLKCCRSFEMLPFLVSKEGTFAHWN